MDLFKKGVAQFNLSGFGGSYFISDMPFMIDISPAPREIAGTRVAPAYLISPLAAKVTCYLVICPICYQSENHFSICIACVHSSSKCSKADPWNLNILKALCFPVSLSSFSLVLKYSMT